MFAAWGSRSGMETPLDVLKMHAMNRPSPTRPVRSLGFWLRFLSYYVVSLGGGMLIERNFGWLALGKIFVTTIAVVAVFSSWAMARELSPAEVERWERDNPDR